MTSGAETATGLTSAEAEQRLREHGKNELVQDEGPSALHVFAGQLKGALVWLLIAATILSAVLGEHGDAIAIGVILVLNAIIGFMQELRAEKAVHALRKMTAPHARALRDGHIVELVAAHIVPGDVLVLDAGDVVAADARLVDASRFAVNEAALTGESLPTEKRVGGDADGAPLAARRGQVFAGTAVAAGSARAVVTSTGMGTELGKIAKLLGQTLDETTPLQRRLERVGRTLLVLCLGVVALVALVGFLRGIPPVQLMLTSVSLAVAAVLEGLAPS